MAKWYIGCSGFYYKHWKEVFYPAGTAMKNWFQFYTSHFNSVELNGTFYRFPRLPMLQQQFQNSPHQFVFAVKAPKAITHFKQFNNTEQMLLDFYGTIREGLQHKLGPVLFQLPPRLKYNRERLLKIINSLDPGFLNVLECRNVTWWNDEVFNLLSANHIMFCGMSHPDLPQDIIINQPSVYYRFHGIPDLYSSPYDDETLKQFFQTINRKRSIKQVFVFFNNDISTAAIYNAKTLQQMAGQLMPKT